MLVCCLIQCIKVCLCLDDMAAHADQQHIMHFIALCLCVVAASVTGPSACMLYTPGASQKAIMCHCLLHRTEELHTV